MEQRRRQGVGERAHERRQHCDAFTTRDIHRAGRLTQPARYPTNAKDQRKRSRRTYSRGRPGGGAQCHGGSSNSAVDRRRIGAGSCERRWIHGGSTADRLLPIAVAGEGVATLQPAWALVSSGGGPFGHGWHPVLRARLLERRSGGRRSNPCCGPGLARAT